ncbi:MAG TPA: ABC transporter permease [Candidatus Acidoferrales bacterium]|nr:ABC transporter permease [Candidatus Acidoferrales bacterium]
MIWVWPVRCRAIRMGWHQLRVSIRSVFRAPGVAFTSILTIALAVGMAISVFSVVNAILLRPLPYREPGRLAVIWSSSPNDSRGPVSFDDFEDWRRDSRTLESAALYSSYFKPILSGYGDAVRLPALLVSHQYFEVMQCKPWLGRFFLPAEDRDGRDDVVVLSHGLWREKFQADPHVIGRAILINSRPHTIVGVAGPDLHPLPPSYADQPAEIYRPIGEPFGPGSRDGRHLDTLVRLRRGISIEQAQAELNVRSAQMAREHPDVDAKLAARIVLLRDDMTRVVRPALLSLQAAVFVLMLIACANIANLLLARSSARRREMAIRGALGAPTVRLAAMLLTESLVIGISGGICGLVVAMWGTAGMSAIASRVLPDAGSIAIDWRVLLFSLVLSLGASLLFGSAPVLKLGASDLEDALRNTTRVAGDSRNGLRRCLAAVQIALALVLLVAAGLLGKSLLRLQVVSPGFDPRGVTTASMALPRARYGTLASVDQFYQGLLERLRVLPGVTGAAIVSVVPLSGDFDRTGFQIAGKQFGAGEMESPDRYIVSPGYFGALHVPLLQGRLFTEQDDANHPTVCVISATAARQWFPGQSPLGQKVRAGSGTGNFDQSPFREVIGVVGDIAQYGLGLPPTPQIYMPYMQFPARYVTVMIRSNASSSNLAGAVRQTVFSLDREQPVYDVRMLEDIVSGTIATRRIGIWLLGVFAAAALLLAAVGVYGVVSYSVSQRTSEFGIRVALGARPADVIRKALADSLWITASGLGVGIAGSYAMSKWISGFLFQVSPRDAATFGLVPLFLTVVALAACYVPARRAATVDPVTALRSE